MNILFDFDYNNLLFTALVSFGVQAFFFAFASTFKTDKLTDLVYGMTFIILAALFLFLPEHLSERNILIMALIIIWGLRLAAYLFARILKIKHDARFDGRRENFLNFLAFWSFQGAVIFIAFMPGNMVGSSDSQSALGLLDYIGAGMWLVGFIIETVADAQKFAFRNKPENKGKFMGSGLFKYSRYPNYFGEILLWWGIFVIGIPVYEGLQWLAVLGPLFITFILLKVSGIPLLEESSEKRYGHMPEFQAYRKNTSLLIPLPPGRA